MNKTKKKNLLGFTLIELLGVIAIIGLLATIVLVSMSTARIKARNAKRKADAHQLITALELYNSEHNETYPNGGAVGAKDKKNDIQKLSGFLVPTYLGFIPNDPKNAPANYQYIWNNNGNDFGILVPYSDDGGMDCQIDTPGADNSNWFKTKGQVAPICNY